MYVATAQARERLFASRAQRPTSQPTKSDASLDRAMSALLSDESFLIIFRYACELLQGSAETMSLLQNRNAIRDMLLFKRNERRGPSQLGIRVDRI